jgi:hypothetical protein
MSVGSEVAAGAIGAGGEIAAAAVDMVQTAAERIAGVATGAVRPLSPEDGGMDGTDADQERKGRGNYQGS